MSGMAKDSEYELVLVIVDRLTKWSIFIPLPKKVSSVDVAQALLEMIVLEYRVPEIIVSDHDVKFTNAIWEHFTRCWGIVGNISTPYNPQSDGQVEHVNKTMVEYFQYLL